MKAVQIGIAALGVFQTLPTRRKLAQGIFTDHRMDPPVRIELQGLMPEVSPLVLRNSKCNFPECSEPSVEHICTDQGSQ
jgi:hypothetical protein